MTHCTIPMSTLSNWIDEPEPSSRHQQLSRHIASCPECSRKINSLTKLRNIATQAFDHETVEQASDSGWMDQMLSNLAFEARAGRSIPLESPLKDLTLSQTEGAIVAAARAVADQLDEVIIGRCRLVGDLETLGAPIEVEVTASVQFGAYIPDLAQALRASIRQELERVSELNVTAINITIQDLHTKPQEP